MYGILKIKSGEWHMWQWSLWY